MDRFFMMLKPYSAGFCAVGCAFMASETAMRHGSTCWGGGAEVQTGTTGGGEGRKGEEWGGKGGRECVCDSKPDSPHLNELNDYQGPRRYEPINRESVEVESVREQGSQQRQEMAGGDVLGAWVRMRVLCG